MFLAVHAPVGALIGAITKEPISAFALAGLSHIIIDIIPHGDKDLFKNLPRQQCVVSVLRITFFDGLLVLAALFLMFWPAVPADWPAVCAGIIGGVLPDVLSGLSLFIPSSLFFQRWHDIHHWFHDGIVKFNLPLFAGFIEQAAILATVIFIFRFAI